MSDTTSRRRDFAMQPFVQYFGVLGERDNHDLYHLALSKREVFTRSRTTPSKFYPDWRKSKVIYENQFGNFAVRLEREIRLKLPEVMTTLGIPAFEIGSFEFQLTTHNDGEFYKWHTDNGTRETENRIVTFVYYFHSMPRRFHGGDLAIHLDNEQKLIVVPTNDSMILFSSHLKHEVREVLCPSGLFGDGRFTINGWIRKKNAKQHNDYFDARIFSAPTRTRYSATMTRTVPAGAPSPHVTQQPDTRTHEDDRRQSGENAPQDKLAWLESLMNLYSNLHRQSRRAGTVDVRQEISQMEFYESYYFLNRPIVLKGFAAKSLAVNTWSPEFFTRNYRSAPVQITAERNRFADYEADFRQTVQTITMAEFVERLYRAEETNDFYLVARNYFFENPALSHLRDDLQPPPEIIDTANPAPGAAKLWFGPKGTVTPLHYDEHSILFMQIFGRKHFKLVPPFELSKLYQRKRYYSSVDPEDVDSDRYPEFSMASLADVELDPGDILFIPAGWWHWVKSLEISISATFCSFHVQNGNTLLKTR